MKEKFLEIYLLETNPLERDVLFTKDLLEREPNYSKEKSTPKKNFLEKYLLKREVIFSKEKSSQKRIKKKKKEIKRKRKIFLKENSF